MEQSIWNSKMKFVHLSLQTELSIGQLVCNFVAEHKLNMESLWNIQDWEFHLVISPSWTLLS